MLQLEKIKNIIDKNEEKILYRNEGHKLDFFKTSDFKLKKQSKKSKFFSALIWLLYAAIGYSVYSFHNKNQKINAELLNGNDSFSEIYKEIDEKNTIDINQFGLLTRNRTAYGSLMSSIIVQKILLRDSIYKDNKDFAPELYKNYKPIDPKVKDEIFKIFINNWEYGLKKEKELYSNCGVDVICHYTANRLANYHDKVEDMVYKQVVFVKHPDILNKHLELIKLQVKYQSFYK